jgi:hypothetical protein
MPRTLHTTLLTALLLVAGCKTLSAGGEQVRTVRSENSVADCEFVTEVKAEPPFVGPNDAENTLRNKTALADGDVVLITDMLIGTARGEAYDCSGEQEDD